MFSEDLSLMPVKWAIKAVILNDMEMLKNAIENREEVYTVWVPTNGLVEKIITAINHQWSTKSSLFIETIHQELTVCMWHVDTINLQLIASLQIIATSPHPLILKALLLSSSISVSIPSPTLSIWVITVTTIKLVYTVKLPVSDQRKCQAYVVAYEIEVIAYKRSHHSWSNFSVIIPVLN